MANVIEHTVALAAALKALAVTHQLHDTLSAVARAQASQGYGTIPGVAVALGVTCNATRIQVFDYPDLIAADVGTSPRRLTLTPAGIALLAKIKERTQRYEPRGYEPALPTASAIPPQP